jgi:hypothetical protein
VTARSPPVSNAIEPRRATLASTTTERARQEHNFFANTLLDWNKEFKNSRIPTVHPLPSLCTIPTCTNTRVLRRPLLLARLAVTLSRCPSGLVRLQTCIWIIPKLTSCLQTMPTPPNGLGVIYLSVVCQNHVTLSILIDISESHIKFFFPLR